MKKKYFLYDNKDYRIIKQKSFGHNDNPWSSYGIIISDKPINLKRDEVVEIYGSKENFIDYHKAEQDLEAIFDLIIDSN